MESARVGKRGAIIVPAKLRKRFGIEEGTIVIAEEKDDGILIRPAVVVPVERYTPERKAEFLLSNAVDEADYRRARKEVLRLGIDEQLPPGLSYCPSKEERLESASSCYTGSLGSLLPARWPAGLGRHHMEA